MVVFDSTTVANAVTPNWNSCSNQLANLNRSESQFFERHFTVKGHVKSFMPGNVAQNVTHFLHYPV